MSKATDAYAHQLLARAMYHKWCKHHARTPRPWPYADAGSMDYAATAIDLLGYDDEAIVVIEDQLSDWGDSL